MTNRLHHRPGDKLLGNLTVLEQLGSGAYGTVYHCRDAEGQQFAVKEMHV